MAIIKTIELYAGKGRKNTYFHSPLSLFPPLPLLSFPWESMGDGGVMEKTNQPTLKSTNERIDELEKRLGDTNYQRLEKMTKRNRVSSRISLVLILLIFISSLFILHPWKGRDEVRTWSLFKTEDYPKWLEINLDKENIALITKVDQKGERVMYDGDEYMVLEHKTRIAVKRDNATIAIYGNGILYGGYTLL